MSRRTAPGKRAGGLTGSGLMGSVSGWRGCLQVRPGGGKRRNISGKSARGDRRRRLAKRRPQGWRGLGFPPNSPKMPGSVRNTCAYSYYIGVEYLGGELEFNPGAFFLGRWRWGCQCCDPPRPISPGMIASRPIFFCLFCLLFLPVPLIMAAVSNGECAPIGFHIRKKLFRFPLVPLRAV